MKPIGKGDALLVVDMQVDFINGTLAIKDAEGIIPEVNKLIHTFRAKKLEVWYSKDWHEPGDKSFNGNGGAWPVHCVQNTDGATLHPDLYVYESAKIVFKSQHPDVEEYSAFEAALEEQVKLADVLGSYGVRRVFVCGLATDYCVGMSALDSINEGFKTVIVWDAVRSVSPQKVKEMMGEYVSRGGRVW